MNIVTSFQKWLVALLLAFTLPAQAAVISVTDGFVGVYEPTNTYVPTGQIGPDFFSFKFLFTNPDHSFEVTIQAPDDLLGSLEYAVTSGLDFAGLQYFGDLLTAGQSATFEMGGIAGTTPAIQVGQSLTLRALGVTTPYLIGASDDPIITGTIGSEAGNGNGNDNGNGTNPVPEPPIMLLLAGGLLTMLGFTAERKRIKSEVSA